MVEKEFSRSCYFNRMPTAVVSAGLEKALIDSYHCCAQLAGD